MKVEWKKFLYGIPLGMIAFLIQLVVAYLISSDYYQAEIVDCLSIRTLFTKLGIMILICTVIISMFVFSKIKTKHTWIMLLSGLVYAVVFGFSLSLLGYEGEKSIFLLTGTIAIIIVMLLSGIYMFISSIVESKILSKIKDYVKKNK